MMESRKVMTQKKNSILIVDDEKINLMFLHNLLSADYALFVAKDGIEAIKKANELLPDMILLDIIMPGMDGFEVLAELKSSEITRDIPVIFITGLNNNKDEEKGLALNATDYITKPFSAAVVKLRVDNQIRSLNQKREIELISMTDPLTGIANRRCFDQQMKLEWRRAIRDQLPISILMIDVDKFKSFNDTYGHQMGDDVLVTVAGELAKALRRPADFAARWGGEEFVILLPATDKNGALSIAESIRANIESVAIPCHSAPAAAAASVAPATHSATASSVPAAPAPADAPAATAPASASAAAAASVAPAPAAAAAAASASVAAPAAPAPAAAASVSVTISVGVNTRIPELNADAAAFIAAADTALYAAKETGRNRVCFG